jgi:hypothetical protein
MNGLLNVVRSNEPVMMSVDFLITSAVATKHWHYGTRCMQAEVFAAYHVTELAFGLQLHQWPHHLHQHLVVATRQSKACQYQIA